MAHKRLVFYFTATGNNLYVARQFRSNPLSIPQVIKEHGHGRMHWEADEIGIVYPIYWQKPPVKERHNPRHTDVGNDDRNWIQFS